MLHGGEEEPAYSLSRVRGVDQSSLGWKLHCYALSVRTGKIEDPSWLVRMFGAEARDDWTDPEVWKKAHPGIGITISESFVREECIRALGAPGNVDAFRRSCLNVWASQTQRWIDLDKWDLCQQNINWDLYNGRACRIGLDLSATRDLTAIVVAFLETDDNYSLLPFAFCPEEAIDQRGHGDGADYRDWINRGFLTATGGNVVDYAAVQQKVLELRRRYDVLEVLYDKWCASMLVDSLLDGGIACVPIRQDAGFMNSAVRELEQAVDEKRLRHDGNPILRWCVSNACLKANAAGEVRLTKRRSRERIDLAVASLFAFSGFLDNRNRHSFSRFDGARGDAR